VRRSSGSTSARRTGLAWRPQTGQLYGLGVNAAADTATLYLVDPRRQPIVRAVGAGADRQAGAGVDARVQPAVGDEAQTIDRGVEVDPPAGARGREVRPDVGDVAGRAHDGHGAGLRTTSEPGRATIGLLRELPGRRNGKTCSATRKVGKRCTIRKAYGSITKVVVKPGKVTVTVKGKVSKRALVAGAGRVDVTVRDVAGNTSALGAKGVRVRR
jgi:hypothetical protein